MTTLPFQDDGDETPEDLAAAHALGVTDGAERRAAERRMTREPGFAAEVEAWRRRLDPLTALIRPVEPPPSIWSAIERDLDRLARVPAPAQRSPAARPDLVAPFWRWLGLGASALAAASLAGLLVLAPGRFAEPQGAMTATLASPSGQALFTIVLDRESHMATLIPVSQAAEPGRVPELWLIDPAGGHPRSLGIVSAAGPIRMPMRRMEGLPANPALAVSMEPEGGSPTGLPTGPVVATGSLSSI